MSFGLGHGKPLDPAPGVVAISPGELPPLPDDILTNPDAGRLDPRSWFGDPTRPFELEIGSGKGTFLLQQGGLEPGTNFLGIEWAGEFAAYAADRIRRRRESGELTNVRMLNADATELLRWRCPDAVIRVIHLYFSDPWPKRRHHKKRVIQHAFLAEAWRVLEPGGELRVVTDHDDLWAWDAEHFKVWSDWATTSRDREGAGESEDPLRPPLADSSLVGTGAGADMAATQAVKIPPVSETTARLLGELPGPPFEVLGFDRPASAGDGELVGSNFERKFRVEGRSFHACVLQKRI